MTETSKLQLAAEHKHPDGERRTWDGKVGRDFRMARRMRREGKKPQRNAGARNTRRGRRSAAYNCRAGLSSVIDCVVIAVQRKGCQGKDSCSRQRACANRRFIDAGHAGTRPKTCTRERNSVLPNTFSWKERMRMSMGRVCRRLGSRSDFSLFRDRG
jgi:hypothetical protein